LPRTTNFWPNKGLRKKSRVFWYARKDIGIQKNKKNSFWARGFDDIEYHLLGETKRPNEMKGGHEMKKGHEKESGRTKGIKRGHIKRGHIKKGQVISKGVLDFDVLESIPLLINLLTVE
jgi:hypothetical protein